jgi:hypothetical protein
MKIRTRYWIPWELLFANQGTYPLPTRPSIWGEVDRTGKLYDSVAVTHVIKNKKSDSGLTVKALFLHFWGLVFDSPTRQTG